MVVLSPRLEIFLSSLCGDFCGDVSLKFGKGKMQPIKFVHKTFTEKLKRYTSVLSATYDQLLLRMTKLSKTLNWVCCFESVSSPSSTYTI